jgi:hypothetical protein
MTFNYGFIYVKDRPLSPVAQEYMSIVKEIEADVATRNDAIVERYSSA